MMLFILETAYDIQFYQNKKLKFNSKKKQWHYLFSQKNISFTLLLKKKYTIYKKNIPKLHYTH
jgi:hypothetical protein